MIRRTTTAPRDVYKRQVADTGCGISPEVMGSIYEPFLTTKSTGSGLGLLIVRRIVK